MSVHSAPVKLGKQKSNLRNKSIFQPEWVTWFFPEWKSGWTKNQNRMEDHYLMYQHWSHMYGLQSRDMLSPVLCWDYEVKSSHSSTQCRLTHWLRVCFYLVINGHMFQVAILVAVNFNDVYHQLIIVHTYWLSSVCFTHFIHIKNV